MLLSAKLSRLQKLVRENDIDALFLVQQKNHEPTLCWLQVELPEQVVCVVKPSSVSFFVSPLELTTTKIKNKTLTIKPFKKEWKKQFAHKKIGVDAHEISFALANQLKKEKITLKNMHQALQQVRAIKTPEEHMLIKKACALTDRMYASLLSHWNTFKTEQDAVSHLFQFMKQQRVEPAFEPIVASGINAAEPHAHPRGKIKRGFVVVDIGIRYKGYCSDFTRTFFYGKPTMKEKEWYAQVRDAQKKTIAHITNEKKCAELDAFCRKQLGKNTKWFTHALGHGLGTAVHEFPFLSKGSKDELQEGMVFTVEPGTYIPKKGGIRIEDVVAITKKGVQRYTKTHRGLIIL